MKYLNQIKENKFSLVILFVLTLSVGWYINGSYKSKLLADESLVTVGIITDSDNNTVKYKFYFEGREYSDFYSFSPGKHFKRVVGEKIYVRFNPNRPKSVSYALFKDKKIEVEINKNETIDSLNTEPLKWWWFGKF